MGSVSLTGAFSLVSGFCGFRLYPFSDPETPRQRAVEQIGKRLDVLLRELLGAFGVDASSTEFFHQVARREAIVYRAVIEQFAADAYCDGLFFDDARGERDVTGDNYIARRKQLDNFVVRHIGPVGDGDQPN